ncbi:MAG: flavodoxin domain-containing protein [Opitutae bacterium]|nr:flavodoxin domain-containing protein [Opitutae bacterium]
MSSTVLILYASVSGTAEELAALTALRLRTAGSDAVAMNVAEFPAMRLTEFDTVLVIASTWGEGEPPPDAEEFVTSLGKLPAESLPDLRYAVLALGSRAYPEFCAFGRRLDEDLARAGARRLLPRVECDTKFKADYEAWFAAVLAQLKEPHAAG